MLTKLRNRDAAFTLVEVVVTMTIIAILAAIVVATLAGLRQGDSIDRAVQAVYSDLILIRSRSVSTNQDHRLNFLSTSQWKIESYDSATSTWSQVSQIRNMPSDTNLIGGPTGTGAGTIGNAGANLSAVPRGLFILAGTSVGTPYVMISALGTSKTKSIYVDVGGSVEIRTP